MRIDKEYSQAVTQAKGNLADLNERGADAIGGNVLEFMESILTPDEIAESELRVSRWKRETDKNPTIYF